MDEVLNNRHLTSPYLTAAQGIHEISGAAVESRGRWIIDDAEDI